MSDLFTCIIDALVIYTETAENGQVISFLIRSFQLIENDIFFSQTHCLPIVFNQIDREYNEWHFMQRKRGRKTIVIVQFS